MTAARTCLAVAVTVGLAVVAAVPARARAQSAAVRQLVHDGGAAYAQGDYRGASASFDRAIAVEPRQVDRAVYAQRIAIFVAEGRYREGLRWIIDVAERYHPDDVLILRQKAILLARRGQRREAIALAERIIPRDPDAYALYFLLGDHYLGAGPAGMPRAVNAYQRYLQTRPPELARADGEVQIKLGHALLRTGRYRDAARVLEQVRGGPASARTAVVSPSADARGAVDRPLCAAYVGAARWVDAARACTAAITAGAALHRADAASEYNLARADLALGRHADALLLVGRYLQRRPRDVAGHVLRGDILVAARRWDEATEALANARRLGPGDPRVARSLGRMYLASGAPGLAIDELAVAQRAFPADLQLVSDHARACLAAGRSDEAVASVEAALRDGIDPSRRAALLVILGDALLGQGPRLALDRYREARAADPSQPGVTQGMRSALNLLAADAFGRGDLDGADRQLAEAELLDPRDPTTQFNRALIAAGRDQPREVVARVDRVLAAVPDHVAAHRLAARADAELGDHAGAVRHLTAAVAGAGGDATLDAAIRAELGAEQLELGQLDAGIASLEHAARATGATTAGTAATATTADGTAAAAEPSLRHNLAIGYLRRGRARLVAGDHARAIADLEAAQQGTLLDGEDLERARFALGVAHLAAGHGARGRGLLEELARQRGGAPVPWLAEPFRRGGLDYYVAYARYLEASDGALRASARALARINVQARGELRARSRGLLAAVLETQALAAYRRGELAVAERALVEAAALVEADARTALDHDLAVVRGERRRDRGAAVASFEAFASSPPEALVNAGICDDDRGQTPRALALWREAQVRGVRSAELTEWIEAAQRIYPSP